MGSTRSHFSTVNIQAWVMRNLASVEPAMSLIGRKGSVVDRSTFPIGHRGVFLFSFVGIRW